MEINIDLFVRETCKRNSNFNAMFGREPGHRYVNKDGKCPLCKKDANEKHFQSKMHFKKVYDMYELCLALKK